MFACGRVFMHFVCSQQGAQLLPSPSGETSWLKKFFLIVRVFVVWLLFFVVFFVLTAAFHFDFRIIPRHLHRLKVVAGAPPPKANHANRAAGGTHKSTNDYITRKIVNFILSGVPFVEFLKDMPVRHV
jgi:hypothetical protein